MGFGNFGRRSAAGGGAPSARVQGVLATVVGPVYAISRLLGGSSALSLIAGTNANLTLSGINIVAGAALGLGNSQTAVVREAGGLIAVEYPVTLTGVAAAPTNSVLPTISGIAQSGWTLTASTGTWTGSPTYSYQWLSDGQNVGTNSNSYAVADADIGSTIICLVTATNSGGSNTVATAATSPVTPSSGYVPSLDFSDPRNNYIDFI